MDYSQRSMVEQVPPNYTEAERPLAQRLQPERVNVQHSQPASLQGSLSRATIEQQLQPSYGESPRAQPVHSASDYASLRSKERTEYTAKERTLSTAYNPSSTDFVPKDRPNPNFVLPSQMRPPGVAGQPPPPQPRPPFAGARPMVGVGPRPPMPPNMVGRGMPPPLRPTDSKSNLLMGPPPPSQMRPGMPPSQLNMQQAQRLPNSGGPLSPPGQGPPRPPGGFPWAPAGSGARAPPPPQNMTRPPPPTFARPMPGQPLQAPFRPPLYNQQQQQPPQHQQQQQQAQQQQQQLPPPQQQLRPPSAASVHNENDDDDVIMGQAVTPLKTFNMRNDPMGSPLLEETEPPFDTTSPLTDAPFGKAGMHSKY